MVHDFLGCIGRQEGKDFPLYLTEKIWISIFLSYVFRNKSCGQTIQTEWYIPIGLIGLYHIVDNNMFKIKFPSVLPLCYLSPSLSLLTFWETVCWWVKAHTDFSIPFHLWEFTSGRSVKDRVSVCRGRSQKTSVTSWTLPELIPGMHLQSRKGLSSEQDNEVWWPEEAQAPYPQTSAT